ncbi:MAG: LOG family protein [Planctomycetes bacterium]|nr:LOG family protein [Planctomycetota bacterium]
MQNAETSEMSPSDRRRKRAEAIDAFVRTFVSGENEDLYANMLVTICRLGADGADRGDLKILNTTLKELRYAFKTFAPYSEIPKLSMFGSARTAEDHPQYLQAKKVAELIQKQGWMVITGAGDGIMRAGHHGATRQASFGVAISLPFEQSTNTIIANDPKLVNFKYFFTRKILFVKEARAIVLFPGGFGTQDEGFESLTLIQTSKSSPVPVVLCDEPGGTYWRHWRQYVERELLANAMIDDADMHLFYITDSADDAVEHIIDFYRRYHSSRYVGDLFVIRLNSPVSESLMDEINEEYGDILLRGRFEQFAGPLEGEDDVYPDKHRLVFAFDRRSAGRLRLLIDKLNEGSAS